MKIVVDTNIIFSSLVNTSGHIGDLLFNSGKAIDFYSCHYTRQEIVKHWQKLLKLSKLSEAELNESRFKIFSQINFINEELIPSKTWLAAEEIVHDIDVDDVDFLALTIHLKGYLWTRDKVLYNGLKRKKFNRILNTSELISFRGSMNY